MSAPPLFSVVSLAAAHGVGWLLLSSAMIPEAAGQSASELSPSSARSVVVSGVVPDEATRQAILGKAREAFGRDRVVDQLGVGGLVAPPNWSQHVQSIITADLAQVSKGQLEIRGTTIALSGEVESEARRQELVSRISTRLNPTYVVRNGLRAAVPTQQLVDAALANRTIEFEPGNAVLTTRGLKTLDELIPVLRQLENRRFEVIGHTDGQGLPAQNLILSAERSNAVKAYLAAKGIAPDLVLASGAGAERPVAGNDTAEGRSRNRRIEFRVLP